MNKPPQPYRRLMNAMAECLLCHGRMLAMPWQNACYAMAQCLLCHNIILPWQYIFKLKHRSESDILELMNKEVEIL